MYQTVRDAVCSLARLQPIQHTPAAIMPDIVRGQWASRRGPDLVLSSTNWVASTDVGVGLVYGGTSRCTFVAPGTMWGPHMSATHTYSSLDRMEGCLLGSFLDQLGRNVRAACGREHDAWYAYASPLNGFQRWSPVWGAGAVVRTVQIRCSMSTCIWTASGLDLDSFLRGAICYANAFARILFYMFLRVHSHARC
jgi:hypothetical protein